MKNSAGILRSRVLLEVKSRTADGGGGASVAWLQIGFVWANIEPLSGFQRLHAEQLESSITHKITIRYRSDVRAEMRLKNGTRLFMVRSVFDHGERHEWMTMMCEEILEA